MFKIVQRGSEYGSDQEQPHSSVKSEQLSKNTLQNSVIVKKLSGNDGEKSLIKDLSRKTARSAPKNQGS